MSLTIRALEAADARETSALIQRCFDVFVGVHLRPEARVEFGAVAAPEKLIRLREEGRVVLLAFWDGVLAGALGMRDTRHLLLLFVDGAFQGRGIARALWEKAVAACLIQDDSAKKFTVYSSDFAVEVYRRLGFQQIGPRDEKKGIVFTPMEMDVR